MISIENNGSNSRKEIMIQDSKDMPLLVQAWSKMHNGYANQDGCYKKSIYFVK